MASTHLCDLRPGLSAEVTFLVDQPRKVTRLPLQAVRWFGDVPFAAVVAVPQRSDRVVQP